MLLEQCNIKYEHFIIRCNAVKESNSKDKVVVKKPCILVLYKDGFCTRRVSDGKVTSYFYYEVESIKKFNTDHDETQFAFQLNFYAKEYGAKKKVLRFVCEEHALE